MDHAAMQMSDARCFLMGGIKPTANSGLHEIQAAFLIKYYFCISEQETISF